MQETRYLRLHPLPEPKNDILADLGGRRFTDLVKPPPDERPFLCMADVEEGVRAIDLKAYREICINPKPEYCRALDEYGIKEKIERDIKRLLTNAWNYLKKKVGKKGGSSKEEPPFFPAVIMVGEHGSQGLCKLHYHGIIGGIPNDVIAGFRARAVREIGRIEIKYIKHDVAYIDYMFKSYKQNISEEKYKHTCVPETWLWHSYILIFNLDKK